MTTLADAEDRVRRGEAAIREREARGRWVPDTWYDAYEEALRDLLAAHEREHPEETARYRASVAARRGPLVQHNRLPGVR